MKSEVLFVGQENSGNKTILKSRKAQKKPGKVRKFGSAEIMKTLYNVYMEKKTI